MSDQSFFKSNGPLLAADIAKSIGAVINHNATSNTKITKAAPIEAAINGAISFLDNKKYIEFLQSTSASAVICNEENAKLAPDGLCVLVHEDPYRAYGQALQLLFPTAMRPQKLSDDTGVSARAYIGKNVEIEDDVTIEPGCVVGDDASIGSGTQILAGAIIGAKVQIGRNSTIGNNATVINTLMGDNVIVHSGVSIGQDGFGYAMSASGHDKIPQIGRVIIQDSVEIGANTAIDRGANRDTIIGEGTKIDNLVQIGHNVVIGRHCVIVGLVGISGSVTLGDFVVVGGQAGIVGHVNIGKGVQIGGGSGVQGDVKPGEKVMGYPSIPANIWMRQAAKTVREAKQWREASTNNKKS